MGAPERFVISIRMTGLGDRMIALAAAWRYARATGRTLVADWRFGGLAPDARKNAFPLCFEPSPLLAGVAFVADEGLDVARFPHPRHPACWDRDVTLHLPMLRPATSFKVDEAVARELVQSVRDVSAPVIVFDGCFPEGLIPLDELRAFFAALVPASPIAAAAAEFRREHQGPMIGLHIRHGNGGSIMGHARWWDSTDAAIDRCIRAVRHARERLQSEAPVLLCTDAAAILDVLVDKLGSVIVRPKQFRPPGEGELHLGNDAWARRDDAMVEMLLLTRCDALIRYPPGSFFSLFAAVMMRSPRETADLHRPWDPADRLSPAVIV